MKNKIKKWFLKTSFANSLQRIDKRFLYITFFDFVYYVIFLLSTSYFYYNIFPYLALIQRANPLLNQIDAWKQEGVFEGPTDIHMEVVEFKLYVIGLILLIFFSYSFFKWLIWNMVQNKKLEKMQFLKFCGLNLVFAVIFIALTALLWILFMSGAFAVIWLFILVPLSVYFVNNLHPIFVNMREIWISYAKTASFSARKILYFILPYIIITMGFFIVFEIYRIFWFLPDIPYLLLFVLLLAAYLNWAKLYILSILEKVRAV